MVLKNSDARRPGDMLLDWADLCWNAGLWGRHDYDRSPPAIRIWVCQQNYFYHRVRLQLLEQTAVS